jgi:YhcH/YjgK/YiaL family protein
MIIDKLQNAEKYYSLGENLTKAFKFLKETDLSIAKEGRFDIEGDNVYALINNYNTKDPKDCHPEAHRKYADVQYIVSGAELIGCSLFSGQKVFKDYDEEKDYLLYDDISFFLKLNEGMFAVFFPDDLHMPGIMINEPKPVKKVVVKVRI